MKGETLIRFRAICHTTQLRTICISITDQSPLVSVIVVSSILDESFWAKKKTTQMKVYYDMICMDGYKFIPQQNPWITQCAKANILERL